MSDVAKSENRPEDMTVYVDLESTAILNAKFRMNPVSNYTVYWFMGNSELQDTNIINTAKGEHVQTTYAITNVTKEQLGNYTAHVINQAITTEHNEVTLNVLLALRGKKSKAVSFLCMTIVLMYILTK